MSDDSAPLIELGAVGAPFGVRGWVKVRSYTEPAERLLDHRVLHLGLNGVWKRYRIEFTGRSAGQLTVKFEGVSDRDTAAGLRGASISVPRSELPERGRRDFYRADMIGCEAVNLAGAVLGVVENFVETPGQVLMIVRGAREYWVPAVPRHLRRVDLQARRVHVDWDEPV